MAKSVKAKCEIDVGTVQGSRRRFPLSQSGWAGALRTAREIAGGVGNWLALVDLDCPGGRIAMYQCGTRTDKRRVSCGIESVASPEDNTPAIAGATRKRRRRRRR